ncbi:MAG: CHAT domain-containing protein [Bacteroidetes bacterium]|nr:CHAT domain-containing protein [Bacteroidota bacterium]
MREEILRLVQLAHMYIKRGDLDLAEQYYHDAYRASWQSNDIVISVNVLVDLGILYRETGRVQEAIQTLTDALNLIDMYKLSEEIPVIHALPVILKTLATLYINSGVPEEGEQFVSDAIRRDLELYGEKSIELAEDHHILSTMYFRMNQFDKAKEILINKVLNDVDSGNAAAVPLFLSAFMSLGNVLVSLNKFSEAEDYCLRGLQLAEKYVDTIAVIMYNNLLGIIYKETGQFEQSVYYLRKAENSAMSMTPLPLTKLAPIYNQIGETNRLMRDYSAAIRYFEKALEIDLDLGINPGDVASDYNNIAVTYRNMGNYSESINLQKLALKIDLDHFGEKSLSVANDYWNIGHNYFADQQFRIAVEYLQQSLISLSPVFNSTDHARNPDPETCFSKTVLLKVMIMKAICLSYLEDLPAKDTLNSFDEALKLYETIRDELSYESDKVQIMNNITENLFPNALAFIYGQYEVSGNELLKHKAFEYLEKCKNYLLLSMIWDSDAMEFSGIPADELSLEKELEFNINNLRKQLSGIPLNNLTENCITSLKEKYHEAIEQKSLLIKDFEKKYPEYFRLKYGRSYSTPGQIRERCEKEEVIVLNYFLSDQSIHIIYISAALFEYKQISLPTGFSEMVKNFTLSINQVEKKKFIQNSYALYRYLILLVKPFLDKEKCRNLRILPHGILFNVPFETLLDSPVEENSDTGYKDLPFLLKRYSVSYHFSATLWDQVRQRGDRKGYKREGGLLAMAPCCPGNPIPVPAELQEHGLDQTFKPLAHSAGEVDGIARYFKNAKVLTFKEATKTRFIELMQYYDYVHIATHGFFIKENPNLSGIVFFPENYSLTDGSDSSHILYNGEVYNLSMSPRLLGLSACDTGVGEFQKGEGLMSVSRAFIYSGCNDLVVSLWSIDDLSSSQLMETMYRILSEEPGISVGIALTRAKLEFLMTAKMTAPFFWSGLVHIG